MGKVCAAQQYRQIAQLAEASRGISWEASKLWNRALEYASPEMKAKLEAYLAASRKLAQEEEQAREERRRTEKERREKEKQQAEAAGIEKMPGVVASPDQVQQSGPLHRRPENTIPPALNLTVR